MAEINAIKVQSKKLTDASQKMKSINSRMTEKLEDINKTMNNLEESWSSDAATEIRSNINKLKPRIEEYKSVIKSYCDFLDQTAQSYETTESAIEKNATVFK